MLRKTEKAVLKPQEKEIFEFIDKEPILPKVIRLANVLRSKLCQMLQLRQ